MQPLTIAVAIIFSSIALYARPAYALAAYMACLLWYPSYLVVTFGTIDISASRFVVAVLFLRCFLDPAIKNSFKWSKLDTVVTLSVAIYFITYCCAVPLSKALENRLGFLMDSWFAYMVVRYTINSKKSLLTVVKVISVVLIPLAILGVIESVTYWQPFAPLIRYCPWATFVDSGGTSSPDIRFGFARALGPFSHAILFGCSFAMFLPLVFYLRQEGQEWRTKSYIISGILLVGALSSMSSGPWVMVMVMIFCLILERHKEWARTMLIMFISMCIFVEFASNRPFYHVIVTRFANPLGGAGWHRARLIDLAIEHFNEWWFLGYGLEDPGWGPELGMGMTDVTNEFILAGVRYGILGLIALIVVIITSFRCVALVHKRVYSPKLKSMAWALGSILFSIVVTWMSVSFFGQLIPLFYCFLGFIGSFAYICGVQKGY